ncbi:MAG: VWA domain-containing protein [Micavibrio sp.]|nr:MAG: VWA domain-containing protein [Micavibrio sp.]
MGTDNNIHNSVHTESQKIAVFGKPESGTTIHSEIGGAEQVFLGFSPADIAKISVNTDGALQIGFKDGGTLAITDYAATLGGENPPNVQLTGGETVDLSMLMSSLSSAVTMEMSDAADEMSAIETAAGDTAVAEETTAEEVKESDVVTEKSVADAQMETLDAQGVIDATDLAYQAPESETQEVIKKPGAGEKTVFQMESGKTYTLDFGIDAPSDAAVINNNLIISFGDGGQILIPNYGAVSDSSTLELPDGTPVKVSEFPSIISLATQLAQIEPAAGDAATPGGAQNTGFGFQTPFQSPSFNALDAIGPINPTELQYRAPDREYLGDLLPDPETVQLVDGANLVDETDLAGGAQTVADQVTANFSSGSGTFSATGESSVASSVPLTSGGTPVTIALTGDTYVGSAGGTTIFTLELQSDGTYSFTLYGTLDHPDTTDPNDAILINFGVTASGSGGGSAQGFITITVLDDGPIANDDFNRFDRIDGGTTGNVITGEGSVDPAAAADVHSQDGPNTITEVSFGGIVVAVPETGTAIIFGDNGFLEIAADGSYTYTYTAPTAGTVNDVFTYGLTDGDGDTSYATLTLEANGLPTIGKAVSSVDESDFAGGATLTVSDTVSVDYDGEAPGTIAGNGNTSADAPLTTDGTPIDISYDSTTGTYTGTAGGETIFTLVINNNGDYTFTQFQTIDHPDATDPNDTVTVSFGITVTDADGDSADGNILITIYDDGPVANDDLNKMKTGEGTTSGNVITGEGSVDEAAAADQLSQDGPNTVQQVSFAGTSVTVPETGSVTLDGTYGTLEIFADGSYTYTLSDTHGIGYKETVTDVFIYTLVDNDGDTSPAKLTIKVKDNTPEGVVVKGDKLTLDETDLAGGTQSYSDQLDATFDSGSGTFSATGLDTVTSTVALTSGGVPVDITLDGNTYVGTAGGETIFTLILQPDGNYTFTLYGTLDHPDTTDPNDAIVIDFGITATGSDGGTDSAFIHVTILDDGPVANDDFNKFEASAAGGGSASGNVITGEGSVDPDAAADNLSQDGPNTVTKISFGGTTIDVPEGGSTTIDGTYGSLEIFSDGSYTYTLVDGWADMLSYEFTETVEFPPVVEGQSIYDLGFEAQLGIEAGSLNVNYDTTGTVTFVSEAAGYNNTLGVYTIKDDGTIGDVQFIILNGNDASPGDSLDFDIPGSNGQSIGFFLIADGERKNDYGSMDFAGGSIDFIYKHGTPDARPATIHDSGADILLVYTPPGGGEPVILQDLPGSGHHQVFHTTERGDASPDLNPDGTVRVLSGLSPDGALRIGFEDLPNLGDKDYDDLVFDLVIGPDCPMEVFTYELTDGDGDTSLATLTLKIQQNDVPQVVEPEKVVLDETDLAGGALVHSDTLQADFGADAPGTFEASGTFGYSGSVAGGTLTSGGVAVVVTATATGYTGTAGGETIFTLDINPATGDYTFTLHGTLDHADVNDPDDVIELSFGFNAVDADGDAAGSTLTVLVHDDGVTAYDDKNAFDISEGGASGNVITGEGSILPDSADDLSQDGPNLITQIAFGGTVVDVPESGSATIDGDYGTLEIFSDGSYNYTLFPTSIGDGTSGSAVAVLTGKDENGNTVTVEITAVQGTDGVEFTVKLIDGYADLNGFFLDIGGNGGSILSLGGGINMNGAHSGFDYAEQIGTPGSTDGTVTEATFTIDGLSLSDLDGAIYGIRATSTGSDGEGSVKLTGTPNVVPGTPECPKDVFEYTIVDGDGDSDTALLTLKGVTPVLIVGKNVDDVEGSTTDYAVGDGSGAIIGTLAGDILVGDVGGATQKTQTQDYNVAMILDVSGSMSGSRLAELKQAVNDLMNDFNSYDGGTVKVHLIPFSTNAHPAGTFTVSDADGLNDAMNFINSLNANGWTNYEAPMQKAIEWLESDDILAGAENYTYFISDGEPNRYLNDNGTVGGSGNNATSHQIAMDHVTGVADGTNEVAMLQNLGTVVAIGIGVGAITLARLDIIDSNDNALDVADDDISAALSGASPINQLNTVGDDVITAGAGDNIIFGDSLYTDDLAVDHGLSTLPGSGWEVFARLEAGESATNPDWSRDDTIQYIRDNAEHLAQESLGPSGQPRQGGNDLLEGGFGNDIIFGQEGDDIIYGGAGGDNLLYGGSGADTFVFRSGDAGQSTIKDFSLDEGDRLDISDVLAGYDSLAADLSNLSDFVKLETDGGNTLLKVADPADAGSFKTIAVLEGVNDLDVNALFANGNLIA